MDKKNFQRKDKYKLFEPVLYPSLKQEFTHLDIDEDKYKEIGRFTINLLKLNENSIYKLLYSRETRNDFVCIKNNKSIRSEYLKRLVEVNNDYFPHELLLEKFKRKADLTFEEKLKAKIMDTKEKKTDKKNKNEKKEKEAGINKINNLNRRESHELEVIEKLKKSKEDEQINIIEDADNNSETEEENEEQSFEDEDYMMGSEEGGDAGDESEANYSEGGAF